jgi:hypothetical protein
MQREPVAKPRRSARRHRGWMPGGRGGSMLRVWRFYPIRKTAGRPAHGSPAITVSFLPPPSTGLRSRLRWLREKSCAFATGCLCIRMIPGLRRSRHIGRPGRQLMLTVPAATARDSGRPGRGEVETGNVRRRKIKRPSSRRRTAGWKKRLEQPRAFRGSPR